MNRRSELIRNHLLLHSGAVRRTLDDAKNNWSEKFVCLMRNRMLLGTLRYGSVHDPGLPKYDHCGYAVKKIEQYLQTGNKEFLVDAANLCLVEFEHPCCHKSPHFKATDDEDHVISNG